MPFIALQRLSNEPQFIADSKRLVAYHPFMILF